MSAATEAAADNAQVRPTKSQLEAPIPSQTSLTGRA
jgi:hypothetical protein